MAGYANVKETIFSGATGRELRRHPAEVREVQFWLVAGPGRDAFGIFIFEPEMVAIQLGRPVKKIREALDTLIDLGFCAWDEASQFVWVIEMAHHQFQSPLKAVDKRCITAQKWYTAMPRNPFMAPWFDRYADDFHLLKGEHAVERRDTPPHAPSYAPSLGASMPRVLNVLSVRSSLSFESEEENTVSAESQADPTPVTSEVALVDPDGQLKGPAVDAAFDRIWQAYPDQGAVERKDARAQFGRTKPTPALVDAMLAAIEAQRAGDKWQRGYIPKLANWLSSNRWLDRVQGAGATPQLTDRNAKNLGAAQRFLDRRREGGAQE